MDRCTLEKTEDFDNVSTSLSERIYKLTRYNYISKSQGFFFQNLKSDFLKNKVVILLDFSENFLLLYRVKPKVFIGKIPNVLDTHL